MQLEIITTNPYLMDIISKNPQTNKGWFFAKKEDGVIVGKPYSEGYKFLIVSKPGYELDDYYLNAPKNLMSIIDNGLPHLFKNFSPTWLNKSLEEIDGEVIFKVSNIVIEKTLFRNNEFILTKYFNVLEWSKNEFSIKCDSIKEGVSTLYFIGFLLSLWDDRYFAENDKVDKIMKIFNKIPNLPYFIGYLIKVKLLMRSGTLLDKYIPVLNEYYGANFTRNDTHLDRKKYIYNQLKDSNFILDIGAGELQYYKYFTKKGYKGKYIAVDIDTSLTNFYKSIDDESFEGIIGNIPETNKEDIILTEVIEHMDLEEAKSFVSNLLDRDFNRLIITTPNKEFNKFYNLEDNQFRHSDHKFEMTEHEFHEFIFGLIKDKIEFKFDVIGDSYQGISPTLSCLLWKK